MITYKSKEMNSIPYLSAFLKKEKETKKLPNLPEEEVKKFFESDILYTRGFMESLSFVDKKFTYKREFQIAKQVSDNYPISWQELSKISYEGIPSLPEAYLDKSKDVELKSYDEWELKYNPVTQFRDLEEILSYY